MLKVLTVVGTRPEIVKLSRVIAELDRHLRHVLVHTGQNFDYELNEIFFQQLEVRQPDHFLDAAGESPAQTIGNVIAKFDRVLELEQPDAVLLLGDTNSSLAVISAKRRKIPIFHMEAGNRCFDQRVPEEINRKIVDHTSDINLVFSEHARRYLLAEGIRPELYRVLIEQVLRTSARREFRGYEEKLEALVVDALRRVQPPPRVEDLELAAFMIVFAYFKVPNKHLTWAHDSIQMIYLTAFDLILYVGIATIFRMMSDAPGAALQTSHRIFTDNILLTLAEVIWAVGTLLGLYVLKLPWQAATGIALLVGSGLLLILRAAISHRYDSGLFGQWWRHVEPAMLRRLLTYGLLVVGAQMADWLYAPANYILIANLMGPQIVADYSPAVQSDGGVLLLVSAVAATLLPRTALAHAAGRSKSVRRYYVVGTLGTAAVLALAAPVVWLAAPLMFRLWLSSPLNETCAILPLVLIHTVVGGSSAVGRSILLAIGRVRPFTISVLTGGICNILLGFVLVRYLHMGLRGIVWATVIAVSVRCLLWLPWYTLRAIRQTETQEAEPPSREIASLPPAAIR